MAIDQQLRDMLRDADHPEIAQVRTLAERATEENLRQYDDGLVVEFTDGSRAFARIDRKETPRAS